MAVRAVRKRVKEGNPTNRRDLLHQFMAYKDPEGKAIPQDEVEVECYAPIGAGSDTTSVAIRGAVLYISTNPSIYRKLMTELDNAALSTGLSTPISFKEVQSLPYLNACLKEVLRLNPPVGTPFPRLIPKGGEVICGYFLPEGTEIGINGWCVARNKEVYGDDANIFRPERWLEDPEKAKYYERIDVAFGAGYTICLGKNIAIMELAKTVVELFRNFNITIADPTEPWRIQNALAILLWDFNILISPRDQSVSFATLAKDPALGNYTGN
jgi:cytochrome P450